MLIGRRRRVIIPRGISTGAPGVAWRGVSLALLTLVFISSPGSLRAGPGLQFA